MYSPSIGDVISVLQLIQTALTVVRADAQGDCEGIIIYVKKIHALLAMLEAELRDSGSNT